MGTTWSSCVPDSRLLAANEKVSSVKKERKFAIDIDTIMRAPPRSNLTLPQKYLHRAAIIWQYL
jgi:hypothetical protein